MGLQSISGEMCHRLIGTDIEVVAIAMFYNHAALHFQSRPTCFPLLTVLTIRAMMCVCVCVYTQLKISNTETPGQVKVSLCLLDAEQLT